MGAPDVQERSRDLPPSSAVEPPDDGGVADRPPPGWRGGAPWLVALVVVLLASSFVAARWQVAADQQVGAFVYAGDDFASDADPPDGLPLVEGTGYDGQFFWRLGNDPFVLDQSHHEGLLIDTPYRTQRLGYPMLAWLLTAGGRGSVSWALVVINVGALAALGALGALEARRRGHTGWLGLSVASVPAFLYSLSRDLSEPMACALLLAAVLALRRERWGWAAAAFSLAVLTREQIVVVVGVYGLVRLWTLLRARRTPGAADLPWLVPAAAFLLLQGWLWAAGGTVPVLEGSGSNLAVPFTDVVPAARQWLNALPGVGYPRVGGLPLPVVVEQVRAIPEALLLSTLVLVALLARLPRPWQWERAAVALMAALAVSFATIVWENPADLRTTADLAVLCWAIVLAAGSRRTLLVLGVATPLVALLPAMAFVYLL